MRYLILFILLFLTACSIAKEEGQVVRVIDGDTFVLDTNEHVRLLCVNTPEKGEPFHDEAGVYLESITLNQNVTLERDYQDKDKYGRLLRYVYVNNQSVNALVAKSGMARPLVIFPNGKKCDELWE